MADDVLTHKALEVAGIEDQFMAGWLERVLRGRRGARQVLRTGLVAEHYLLFLPDDPADVTPTQEGMLSRLITRFQDALRRRVGIYGADPKEDEVMADGDLLLAKAKSISVLEEINMINWLDAALEGHVAVAREILRTGLDTEHYQSLLPEDRSKITSEQFEVVVRLNKDFDAALKKFRDIKRAELDEQEQDDRPGPY